MIAEEAVREVKYFRKFLKKNPVLETGFIYLMSIKIL